MFRIRFLIVAALAACFVGLAVPAQVDAVDSLTGATPTSPSFAPPTGSQTQRGNGYILLDLEDPFGLEEWEAAIRLCIPSNEYDFDLDPDYGVASFDGPLTAAGNPPVSPGILPDKMIVEAKGGSGSPDLVVVGPGAGFGNSSNGVFANFFLDSLSIVFDGKKKAYDFNVVTLLGGPTVDITVSNDGLDPFTFFGVNTIGATGEAGRRYGILDSDNLPSFNRVDIFDPFVDGGAEGIQGYGVTYVEKIPEPGSAALLGFATFFGMMIFRRRR